MHVDIEPTQIGRVFGPDLGIVSDAGAALAMFLEVALELDRQGELRDRSDWAAACGHRKRNMLRRTHFDAVPLKPQRVYQEMNEILDRDTCYVTTIGLSQIAGAQFLQVYKPRNWINCGQAGPLGWTMPAALGVRAADPTRKIVALSGDYDFQFMLEELAVGAQHKLPYLHVVVNNSYLGLIRQAQRGFGMDFEVSLAFDNVNAAPDGDAPAGYGVDHVAVAQALGCQGHPRQEPERVQGRLRPGRGADGRASGAGGAGVHPRAGHRHRDGNRGRRRERVRGHPLPRPIAVDPQGPLTWPSRTPRRSPPPGPAVAR